MPVLPATPFMRARMTARLALATLTVTATLLAGPAAMACDCLVPSLESSWGWSTDVVYMRVTSATTIGDDFDSKIVYRGNVGRSWKGCHEPGTRVRLITASNGAECGMTLQIGVTYLIAANEVGKNTLAINQCDYNIPWSQVTGADLDFLNGHCPGGGGCCGGGELMCLPEVESDSVAGLKCEQFESYGPAPLWPEVDLDEFSPIPSAGNLDLDSVTPTPGTTYWELRMSYGFGGGDTIATSSGAPCMDADDPAACNMAWNNLGNPSGLGFAPSCLPGYCAYYVAVNAGDENYIITSDTGFVSFMAPIDTPEEAILTALAAGYNWSTGDLSGGGGRTSDCGYELLVTQLVGYCDPVSSDRILLRVSPSGLIDELGRQRYDAMCGVCI